MFLSTELLLGLVMHFHCVTKPFLFEVPIFEALYQGYGGCYALPMSKLGTANAYILVSGRKLPKKWRDCHETAVNGFTNNAQEARIHLRISELSARMLTFEAGSLVAYRK